MSHDEDLPLDLSEGSPSVQIHLNILQQVIGRMAGNSAACKTWCITLVAGLLVVVADKGRPELALLTALPIILFASLDLYYLALEKGFRRSYNNFVSKVHRKKLNASDLYSVNPTGKVYVLSWEAFCSFSIWGFYIPLIVMTKIAASVI